MKYMFLHAFWLTPSPHYVLIHFMHAPSSARLFYKKELVQFV